MYTHNTHTQLMLAHNTFQPLSSLLLPIFFYFSTCLILSLPDYEYDSEDVRLKIKCQKLNIF